MTHAENEELRRLLRPVPGGQNDLAEYEFSIKRKASEEDSKKSDESGMK
jgi:hypothetical protein